MPHWRVVLHTLDRSGPPMLARGWLQWLRENHPDHGVDVIALRGGELVDDFGALARGRVLLSPDEGWNPDRPPKARVKALHASLRDLPRADATLLVSVSAGVALPMIAGRTGPIATWVVEQQEAFPPGLAMATARWLAGSEGTRADVRRRLVESAPRHMGSATHSDARIDIAREFVEWGDPPSDAMRAQLRESADVADGELLVIGAGIGTPRKGLDLFLECAVLAERRRPGTTRFVWIGGELDELFSVIRAEIDRLGLPNMTMRPGVRDVVPWLAAADVFLHTARLDTFPLVCLHSALAGTPVVAFSGAGGVPEMFGDTFKGAPFPDIDGLDHVLVELTDPAVRAAAGTEQLDHVATRYVADVAASDVLTALESMAIAAVTGDDR